MATSLPVLALVTSLLGCAGAWGDADHDDEPTAQRSASEARSSACPNVSDERAPADDDSAGDNTPNPAASEVNEPESTNGFDIADPEQAREAFARLRTASCLRVEVNRRDQDTNLDININ